MGHIVFRRYVTCICAYVQSSRKAQDCLTKLTFFHFVLQKLSDKCPVIISKENNILATNIPSVLQILICPALVENILRKLCHFRNQNLTNVKVYIQVYMQVYLHIYIHIYVRVVITLVPFMLQS